MSERERAQLCYVAGPWAYFTTCPLADQWGDDWNDAPYEHNAGEPYEWRDYMKKDGINPYEIVKVAWEGPFVTPEYGHLNSPHSVEEINEGGCAWLRAEQWLREKPDPIVAGTTLAEFRHRVEAAGGTVYEASDE